MSLRNVSNARHTIGILLTMFKPARTFFTLMAIGVIALAQAGTAHAARYALLIGNDSYQEVPTLRNARADADAMGKALQKAGYAVTVTKDRNLKQMKDDVREFKSLIKGGDEVFFFYSGHGVQIEAMNYLLPVDVRAESEDQVRDDALALSNVLSDLREQKPALTLAVVDACRDNPFKGTGRAIGGRGLTGVGGANGQMVIYSAGEGQQALDRLSESDPVNNGLFTRVFMKEMERPGVPIDQVARQVRAEVNRMAHTVKHEQVPAIYDQVIGQYYFYAQNEAPDGGVGEVEIIFWTSVKDSSDPAELRAYLDKYPDGQFSGLAQARIKRIEQDQVGAQSKPVEDTSKTVAREETPAKVEEVKAPVVAAAAATAVVPAPAAVLPAPAVAASAGSEPEKVQPLPAPAVTGSAVVTETVPAAADQVVEQVMEQAPAKTEAGTVTDIKQPVPEPSVASPAVLSEITPATSNKRHEPAPAPPAQATPAPVPEVPPAASSTPPENNQTQPAPLQ